MAGLAHRISFIRIQFFPPWDYNELDGRGKRIVSQSSPGLALNPNAKRILQLMAQGLSDKGIADRLGLSVHTVKWYNRNIFSELQADSRSHAIAIARESHLLGFSSPESGRSVLAQNLPASTTSFVGRRQEVETLGLLLDNCRILTLIGPPGSGKTRLGMELARTVHGRFPDGIWFVSLAALSEPARVLPAVAEILGISQVKGQSLAETLKASLAERNLLLVLDNFEHLLSAGLQLGWLLAGAPRLRVLVTSREALDLYGEQIYAVAPLPFDESVELFLSRARTAHSTFVLNDQNEADIENICRVLDGLPLAIELAAARTRIWPPKTLMTKLTRKLDVLSVSTRDVPARHQTLRNTIGWSFRLLGDQERQTLLWLTVLKGPTSLEIAESIVARLSGGDAPASIETLYKKSLVQLTIGHHGEFCVSLLEIVREFVLEQGDGGDIRRAEEAHAVHFLTMALQAQNEFRGLAYRTWLEVLGDAQLNIDAALGWWMAQSSLVHAAEMVHALRDYWITSSRFLDGIHWVQKVMVRRAHLSPSWRAKMLVDEAFLSFYSGPTVNDGPESKMLDEAIRLAELDNELSTKAWALTIKGALGIGKLDAVSSLTLAHEGNELFRRLGELPGQAMVLCVIGELERTRNDEVSAEKAYQECLKIVRKTGETRRETMVLTNLGFIERRRGHRSQAVRFFVEGIRKALDTWYDSQVLVSPLFLIAGIVAEGGQPEDGAKLLGVAYQVLRSKRIQLQAGDRFECEREAALVQSMLSSERLESALVLGQHMEPREALELAIELCRPYLIHPSE